MRRAYATVICGLVLLTSGSGQEQGIDVFFRDFTAEWIRSDPNLAVATRVLSGPDQQRLEQQITPLSRAWRRERVALAERGRKELQRFLQATLSDEHRLSAELMDWQLAAAISADRYSEYAFPFQQFNGANVTLVSLLTVSHPLVTERDAENYVVRLRQVRARMEEALTEAQGLAARGLVPPRFIVGRTVEQMRQFIATPPAANPLVSAFATRMSTAQGIPEGRRSALRTEAEKVVAADIYPIWEKTVAFLAALEAKATEDAGLWRFERGAEAYADALRRFTTTTLSADDIHEVGLREVARLEGEMDALLRQLNRASGSVKDRVEQLKKDLAYPLDEGGRARIMADIDGFMRDAEARAAGQFDRRPRAPVIARPFARFLEATAAGSYTPPARDGSRPGLFQIPLRPDRMTRFGLRSLVYHETVPGHHFQIALEAENERVPDFRRVRAFGGMPAFSEGWGLYAERLAIEGGWYEGDVEGRLGALDAALFRARRLVVDTGLHAKRWTRQQAIDYGIEASEVERYVVLPGQACAYMLGQMRIVELREKARTRLGPRFSVRDFHGVVLGTGSVPLTLLEQQVDAYITRAGAK